MPEIESLVAPPASPAPNGVTSGPFPTIDPVLVVEHLAAVLEITLGATRRELENIGSLLSKARYSDTVQRCTRFATESQVALYVRKDIISEVEDGIQGIADSPGKSLLLFCFKVHADF
jgi:dynein heavy chain 1